MILSIIKWLFISTTNINLSWHKELLIARNQNVSWVTFFNIYEGQIFDEKTNYLLIYVLEHSKIDVINFKL